MFRTGFKTFQLNVKFDLESGNEHISNKILNRHLSNEQIKRAFALCKEADLITESFNMVGIPFDTPKTILDTIKLNAVIGTENLYFTIYQPYYGTKLGELCLEQGIVITRGFGPNFFSPSILKMATVSSSQIKMFRNYFRILTLYYQFLRKLPPTISDMATKFSDKILSSETTAKMLNLIYPVLWYCYQRLKILRVSSNKVLQKKNTADQKRKARNIKSTMRQIQRTPEKKQDFKGAREPNFLPNFWRITLSIIHLDYNSSDNLKQRPTLHYS